MKKRSNSSVADIEHGDHDAPVNQLKELFVDVVQQQRIDLGQKPAQRPVFLKPHGIAKGVFEVNTDLPDDLKIGVFALGKLDAWVRFSIHRLACVVWVTVKTNFLLDRKLLNHCRSNRVFIAMKKVR